MGRQKPINIAYKPDKAFQGENFTFNFYSNDPIIQVIQQAKNLEEIYNYILQEKMKKEGVMLMKKNKYNKFIDIGIILILILGFIIFFLSNLLSVLIFNISILTLSAILIYLAKKANEYKQYEIIPLKEEIQAYNELIKDIKKALIIKKLS